MRQAVYLTEGLHRAGVELFVIARNIPDLPPFDSSVDIRKIWAFGSQKRLEAKTPLNLLSSVSFSLNLVLKLFKYRRDYDIVHFHGASIPLLTALPFLKLMGKRVVTKVACAKLGTEAGSFYGRYGLLGRTFILILKGVDAFVAISSEIEEGLLSEGYDRRRINRTPNFVELSLFFPGEGGRVRGRNVIFSGALEKRKGLDVFLMAWGEILKVFPESRLTIIGKGQEEAGLKGLAKELGLEDTVFFLGAVENVPSYLRDADLFVLPSYQEGMPNALLEAMACGLPVVATRIGGVVDVVKDGENGLLVEPGDHVSLAEAVLRILGDGCFAGEIASNALKTIREGYSLKGIVPRYIELYKRLLP